MSGWGVTNLANPRIQTRDNTVSVNIQPDDVIDSSDAIFWIAPQIYRGNKVSILCLYVCLSVSVSICLFVHLCFFLFCQRVSVLPDRRSTWVDWRLTRVFCCVWCARWRHMEVSWCTQFCLMFHHAYHLKVSSKSMSGLRLVFVSLCLSVCLHVSLSVCVCVSSCEEVA